MKDRIRLDSRIEHRCRPGRYHGYHELPYRGTALVLVRYYSYVSKVSAVPSACSDSLELGTRRSGLKAETVGLREGGTAQ